MQGSLRFLAITILLTKNIPNLRKAQLIFHPLEFMFSSRIAAMKPEGDTHPYSHLLQEDDGDVVGLVSGFVILSLGI